MFDSRIAKMTENTKLNFALSGSFHKSVHCRLNRRRFVNRAPESILGDTEILRKAKCEIMGWGVTTSPYRSWSAVRDKNSLVFRQ